MSRGTFYLDMTFAAKPVAKVKCYLGFDFGSSNSSFSIVSRDAIKFYNDRQMDNTWVSLSDLCFLLPYPIALPLQHFIAERDVVRMRSCGREAFEGALTLAAYIAYSEWCAAKGEQSSAYFKGMAHRSAGPLWGLLCNCLKRLGANARYSKGLMPLVQAPLYDEIVSAVDAIAQEKHGKTSAIDFPNILNIIGNIIVSTLNKFEGRVRCGRGQGWRQVFCKMRVTH